MTNVNVPELRKVLEFLTANRKKHRQGAWTLPDVHSTEDYELINVTYTGGLTWEEKVVTEESVWKCNTGGCLAGWTAMMLGWRPIVGMDSTVWKDGKVGHVDDITRKHLGLTDVQASILFQGSNSLHDLWAVAEVITDGEITVPSTLEGTEPRSFPTVEHARRQLKMTEVAWDE